MNFILSEFTAPPKHFKISHKVETSSGTKWEDVAKITKKQDAFFFISLLEKLSK
jgi:hypothetical protein